MHETVAQILKQRFTWQFNYEVRDLETYIRVFLYMLNRIWYNVSCSKD